MLNTALGYGAICLGKAWLGLGDLSANAAGYAVGLLTGFLLHRIWTFSHTGPALPALLRFLAIFGVAYALNLGVVVALIGIGIGGYVAQAAGIVPYAAFMYLASRRHAFNH